jgi:DNA-directed RNA polymerase specialized sigma24 family protein
MILPSEKPSNYRKKPLMGLILTFIECDERQKLASLKNEIYQRIAPKFYDRCKKIGSKLYRGLPHLEEQVDEIFQDTFMVAFEELKKFKIDQNWDESICERVILAWLGKIANNLFLNAARAWKKEKGAATSFRAHELLENIGSEFFTRVSKRPTYDKAKFERFWAKQSEMTKEILICCIKYGTIMDEANVFLSDEEVELQKLKNDMDNLSKSKKVQKFIKSGLTNKNTDHLPDEMMSELTARYNVTSGAIRKAKERGLKGLRKCKI